MLRSLYSTVSFRAHQLFIACFCLLRGAFARLNFFHSLNKIKKNNEMPQEMNILCCYSCSMYQVHIVKKSTKWQCKICGKKQSIQVVHFQGTGSDCRKQVQYMNSLKAKQEDQESFHSTTIPEFGLDCVAEENDDIEPCDCPSRAKRSYDKWATKYRESDDDDDDDDDHDDDDDDDDSSLSVSSVGTKNSHEKRRDKSYSLPSTQNFSEIQSNNSRDKTFRSRTYPLAENSHKIREKWEKYLNGDDEGSTSKFNCIQNKILAKPLSPLKNGIFDDSDDDLVDEIDF